MEIQKQKLSKVRTVCFVSNELYPAHKGGIGRLMYNFACHNRAFGDEAEIHILVPSDFPDKMAEVETAFEGLATIHRCRKLSERPEQMAHLIAPYGKGWEFPDLYSQSLEYFYGLLDVQRKLGRQFTIVEFPDFGGWALASIAAKRSGLAFQSSLLSVRLHSTLGLITRYEKYYHEPSAWMGAFLDSERQLLQHADLVVGHVPAIVSRNASHYGFDKAWADNAVVEFPLIALDPARETAATDSAAQDDEDPDFIFSSRLQPFKRPDIFIKAAIQLLENQPTYLGKFRLVSYGWDVDFIQSLKDLIPPAMADRILFIDGLPAAERVALLRRSIVVIPSDYESLCLFAFESSHLGCRLILNRSCEAFGAFDRWIEDENCLMFDGTAVDLAQTMARALDWKPSGPADLTPDQPYWITRQPPCPNPSERRLPETVVACVGFADPADVMRTLLSLRSIDDLQETPPVFFLPRATMGPGSTTATLLQEQGFAVRFLSGFGNSAEELGLALIKLQCEAVVLLQSNYQMHPQFLRLIRQTFALRPSTAVVATHVRRIDLRSRDPAGVSIYSGDLPSLALQDDIVAPAVFALRLSLLKSVPFDDRAGSAWKPTWLREAVGRGAEVVILPTIALDTEDGAIKPSNTTKLTGTIIDNVGIAHGVAARLLGIKPPHLPASRSPYAVQTVLGDGLRAADQIWPRDKIRRDFPLVHFSGEHQGLLIHPLSETVVAARFDGPNGAIRLIEVDVLNARGENNGMEVALGLCPGGQVSQQAAAQFAQGRVLAPNIVTEWKVLEPNAHATISIRHLGLAQRSNSIILLSRVPNLKTDSYCHLICKAVRIHYLQGTQLTNA